MAEKSNGFTSLLGATGNDILLSSNGDQVKFSELEGKIIGLYFAAYSSESCQGFAPSLIEAYNDLTSMKVNFEIIFISEDNDEESFSKHFFTMPWLAVPYFNETLRSSLKSLYVVRENPQLIILNEKRDVIRNKGHFLIDEFGSKAYPFTPERIKELKDEEEDQRMNQTLQSVLVTPSRDFVIFNDGKKVPVSELEGKIVGLYISVSAFRSCRVFTPILVDFYKKLKERGEEFEIVWVSWDIDQESFDKDFMNMPWLAIPFGDKTLEKLPSYFQLRAIPTLVILGQDGKTLNDNVCDYVEEFGIQAYPFSPEKLTELEEIDKARHESQTLESLLVSGELDYVIGKCGIKVPVSELVGKTVLFYFSRKKCSPCRAFTPMLAKAYHKIKAEHPDFEVVFVSCDNEESSFEEYYSEMPWLAVPYNDKRERLLRRTLKLSGIPYLVAIGPTGTTLTTKARDLVMFFGSDAYPFDDDRKKVMDSRLQEMGKSLPEKVRHKLHLEHDLVLSNLVGVYKCNGCDEYVIGWIYCCDDCGFSLHLGCAIGDGSGSDKHGNSDGHDQAAGNEGWICDGEVCYRY